MTPRANPARGEVEVEIDGETYVLFGSYGGMARLQGALGVEGLPNLLRLIITQDARALLRGVECLAIHGDVSKVSTARFTPATATAVQKAIQDAIVGRLEADVKNGEGAEVRSLN